MAQPCPSGDQMGCGPSTANGSAQRPASTASISPSLLESGALAGAAGVSFFSSGMGMAPQPLKEAGSEGGVQSTVFASLGRRFLARRENPSP